MCVLKEVVGINGSAGNKKFVNELVNEVKNEADMRAKKVRLALSILRSIQSSIRPILSSIHLTVDEYDNE